MNMGNAMMSIAATIAENRKRYGLEQYADGNGELRCKRCNELLLMPLHFTGAAAELLGSRRMVPRNCRCVERLIYLQEEQEAARRAQAAREAARHEELANERYREMRFEADDGSEPRIRNACKRYVAHWREMLEGNYGIAFLGNNGSGKTFWAACLANALIDAGASVYMVTVKHLIDSMTADYGADREYMLDKIRRVDFLILDDFGAERGSEYSAEQCFEVIDTRYNAQRPLIVTTNLTKAAIRAPRNINNGRTYGRIVEMCPAIWEVMGERRSDIAARKADAMKAIFKGETQ